MSLRGKIMLPMWKDVAEGNREAIEGVEEACRKDYECDVLALCWLFWIGKKFLRPA